MYHTEPPGSVWYMIWNLRCTVTVDSVLANSKTQNAFLFTVNTIFRHNYPLAVEPGSTSRPLVQKKLGEILYLLICSFLPCLSWLLRSRVRKSRRDLWITLYMWQMVNNIVNCNGTADSMPTRKAYKSQRNIGNFSVIGQWNFQVRGQEWVFYNNDNTKWLPSPGHFMYTVGPPASSARFLTTRN